MNLVIQIITNVLTALYQPFWFAVLLSVFVMFFYLYAYCPLEAGKGWKSAIRVWIKQFRSSTKYRRLFLLTFCTVMILFRTLLNRTIWANPVSNVMGAWWIWSTSSDGTVILTTECIENIILMLPFDFLLLCTAKDRLITNMELTNVLLVATKISFLFSLSIELLQLLLRLGTFQFSDLFYNTLGGFIGGFMYWICYILKHKDRHFADSGQASRQ